MGTTIMKNGTNIVTDIYKGYQTVINHNFVTKKDKEEIDAQITDLEKVSDAYSTNFKGIYESLDGIDAKLKEQDERMYKDTEFLMRLRDRISEVNTTQTQCRDELQKQVDTLRYNIRALWVLVALLVATMCCTAFHII